MATQYNLILHPEIGKTKAAINILIKLDQHFYTDRKKVITQLIKLFHFMLSYY